MYLSTCDGDGCVWCVCFTPLHRTIPSLGNEDEGDHLQCVSQPTPLLFSIVKINQLLGVSYQTTDNWFSNSPKPCKRTHLQKEMCSKRLVLSERLNALLVPRGRLVCW